MNKGGLSNSAGEMMKELDGLLAKIAPKRKLQQKAKFEFEKIQSNMLDLQSFLYHQFTSDPEIEWENPSPVLDTGGTPMPEYEAQYRTTMISSMMQQNETFLEMAEKQDEAKISYYEVETEVITLMERIGVLRTQLGTISALARLATDES